jgi:hypothetical protein
MGACAKKKRVAESKAKKAAKQASQLEEGPAFSDPTTSDIKLPTQSKAKKAVEKANQIMKYPASTEPTGSNPKISGAAPPTRSRVPSSQTSTRHSTRSLSSSSKLGNTSAKGHIDETIGRARPKRSATAAANALLQQLQIDETESDFEEDLDGGSNDETDMITKVLISKIQIMMVI